MDPITARKPRSTEEQIAEAHARNLARIQDIMHEARRVRALEGQP